MRNFTITLAVIRLQDGMGNKRTLGINLGKDDTLNYQLWGSWQPTGTSFSLSNMQLKEPLPINPRNFKSTTALCLKVWEIVKTGVERPVTQEVLNDLQKSLKQE